jgi:phosphoserine aminotransferase
MNDVLIHDPREIVNFSAGPALLPYDVLQEIHTDFFDFQNTGCSILEISHRSSLYMDMNTKTQNLLRELLDIPKNYKILFAHGGASTQFANIPLNFQGKQGYLLTGYFSQKAFSEAQKVVSLI